VKVLLTGATGFIGSNAARALVAAGHEVHAIVRPNSDRSRLDPSLRLVTGDLLDSSFIPPPSSFDCCIHLAWYVEPGKYLDSPLNERWVEASLRLARTVGCPRFVAAGTCLEYALSDGPLRETSATGPRTLYAQSKLELLHALQSLDMETAWVRIFYQYGPHEDPRRLVPYVINGLLRGETVKLVPGEQVRDFLHIEDVGTAVRAVAESQLTGVVNIGSAEPVTIRDLALKIGDAIGRRELIALGAQPYSPFDPMHILADNTKLRSTGWRPRYNLDSGLSATIDWWKRRR